MGACKHVQMKGIVAPGRGLEARGREWVRGGMRTGTLWRMSLLAIPGEAVRELLPMPACIELMAETLAALARGEAEVPLRSALWLPDRSGLLGMMPAHMSGRGLMGIKVVSVMPGNHGTEYDAHQGVVLVYETENGRLIGLVDATAITAIRTAAVSGVATRLLAREDAGDLAILGSGVQATTHLEAMLAVRSVHRIRVWSRSAANAGRFAERESARHGRRIEISADAAAAVEGADIICTTTSSRDPILAGAWVAPGAHINAAGSSVKSAREVDADAVRRSRLFVDRRESTVNEAGDWLLAVDEGGLDESHIAGEIGEILIGAIGGRRSVDEITLFESLGLGVEDLAAAHFVCERAKERGVGLDIELGGRRE